MKTKYTALVALSFLADSAKSALTSNDTITAVAQTTRDTTLSTSASLWSILASAGFGIALIGVITACCIKHYCANNNCNCCRPRINDDIPAHPLANV